MFLSSIITVLVKRTPNGEHIATTWGFFIKFAIETGSSFSNCIENEFLYCVFL